MVAQGENVLCAQDHMVVAITSTYTIIGYLPSVFCESRLISTLPSEKQEKKT